MTRDRFLVAVAVLLFLISLAGIGVSLHAESRQSDAEHMTCEIQNRGLQGQAHLTAIMEDFAKLLEPNPEVHQPTPPSLVKPLGEARQELGAYIAIEHAQPASRTC